MKIMFSKQGEPVVTCLNTFTDRSLDHDCHLKFHIKHLLYISLAQMTQIKQNVDIEYIRRAKTILPLFHDHIPQINVGHLNTFCCWYFQYLIVLEWIGIRATCITLIYDSFSIVLLSIRDTWKKVWTVVAYWSKYWPITLIIMFTIIVRGVWPDRQPTLKGACSEIFGKWIFL